MPSSAPLPPPLTLWVDEGIDPYMRSIGSAKKGKARAPENTGLEKTEI